MLLDDNFEMQGGVRNYLGKTEEVKAPKYWKSSKDSPETELVYITEAEKGLLTDANLHGSLKNGKPNMGASGLLSYDGWGDVSNGVSDTSSSNAGAEGGQGSGSSGNSGYQGDSGNNYTVPTPDSPPGVAPISYDEAGIDIGNVDAEDEYLAPDIDHFKATQKTINNSIAGKGDDAIGDLYQADYSDWSKADQDTYQLEMNKLKGTEGKNYSFYAGNEGTINNTFSENWKDVAATNPNIAKFSPTLRFLVAAGKTLQQNATTDYGTGKYGGYTADGMGSGQPLDQGGWLGRIFNSDGSVNENITETEADGLYKQAQNDLPFLIGNTKPEPSKVNEYFNNLNNTNLGISENYLNTYNTAKSKMANTLNITPNTQQYGYGNSYNDTYSRSMNNTNVFYNYLNEQGLI